MPIAMALNTSCKPHGSQNTRWRRNKSNSGLPGNPINYLIHGSFWTRHSQSQSSLDVHSSGLTLFAGAHQGRSTGLVKTILPSQHWPLSLYSAFLFLECLLKTGQGLFNLTALPKHSLSLGLEGTSKVCHCWPKGTVLLIGDIKGKHTSNLVLVGNVSYLQCSTTLGKGKGKTFLK